MDRIAVNSGREQISALSRSRAGHLGNGPDGDGSRHPTRCREGLLGEGDISTFFGIVIEMFWREHGPPHFHATYGEYEAVIAIDTLDILRGELPRQAKGLVMEWANDHRDALQKNWDLCSRLMHPNPIPPLE
jgi:hypothetical protein